jgi:hypothetical protein
MDVRQAVAFIKDSSDDQRDNKQWGNGKGRVVGQRSAPFQGIFVEPCPKAFLQ